VQANIEEEEEEEEEAHQNRVYLGKGGAISSCVVRWLFGTLG
jgi:hypothetical protein